MKTKTKKEGEKERKEEFDPSERRKYLEEYKAFAKFSLMMNPVYKETKLLGIESNIEKRGYYSRRVESVRLGNKTRGVVLSEKEVSYAVALSETALSMVRDPKGIDSATPAIDPESLEIVKENARYYIDLFTNRAKEIERDCLSVWTYRKFHLGGFLADVGNACKCEVLAQEMPKDELFDRFNLIIERYYLVALEYFIQWMNEFTETISTGPMETYCCAKLSMDIYDTFDRMGMWEKALHYGRNGIHYLYRGMPSELSSVGELFVEHILTTRVCDKLVERKKDYWESTELLMRFLKRVKSNPVNKFNFDDEEKCMKRIADNFRAIGYQDVSLEIFLYLLKRRREYKKIYVGEGEEIKYDYVDFDYLAVVCAICYNLDMLSLLKENYEKFLRSWRDLDGFQKFGRPDLIPKKMEIVKSVYFMYKRLMTGEKTGKERKRKKKVKVCAFCGKNRKELKKMGQRIQKCGGCKFFFYCGKICQKKHWKKHKKYCIKLI